MKVSELIGDKIVKDWLSGIRATENTRGSYLQAMQQFTEHVNKTPLVILEEAEGEIKAGLLMRERNITTYLREFQGKPRRTRISTTHHKKPYNRCILFL